MTPPAGDGEHMTLVYFPGVPAPGVYFPGVHFARVPQDADRRPKSSCWGGQTDPCDGR